MGSRILTFDCKLLEEFLKHGSGLVSVEANALPEDARIASARIHPNGRTLVLTVVSDAYPAEPLDSPLPEAPPVRFRRQMPENKPPQ
jgi:hypothetical protein